MSQAVIRISGSPVTQNNQGSNVFIPTISPIEINDLLENAKIGITIYSVESNKETVAGVFTNGLDGKGELSNFYSDQDSFRININDAGEAQLEEKVYVNRLVTFKVVNGTWNDGSTDDRQISFYGDELESFYLASNQIPGVGSNPNPGYTVGTWDVQPSTSTPIREDITYTYTYENPFLFTTDGDSVVITGYSGEVPSTLLIPSELEGKAVKRIGSSAFDQCVGLTQVVISDGITDIGSSAFAHCTDLESIELPPSIKRIGNGAFILCSSLRNIEISDLTAWCNIKYGKAFVSNNVFRPTL